MEEKWSTDRIVIHAKDEIGTMFKDFDIVDAELNNNGYSVVARLINPFNGSRIALKFNFNKNGEKLSKIASISYGVKTVNNNQIIELLNEKNGRYISMPKRKVKNRNFRQDFSYPINNETRMQLLEAISAQYDDTIDE